MRLNLIGFLNGITSHSLCKMYGAGRLMRHRGKDLNSPILQYINTV